MSNSSSNRVNVSWRVSKHPSSEMLNKWCDQQANINESISNIVLHMIGKFGYRNITDYDIQKILFNGIDSFLPSSSEMAPEIVKKESIEISKNIVNKESIETNKNIENKETSSIIIEKTEENNKTPINEVEEDDEYDTLTPDSF